MKQEITINTHPLTVKDMAEQLQRLIDMYLSNSLDNEIIEAYCSIFNNHYASWLYSTNKKDWYGFSFTVYKTLRKGGCQALRAIINRIREKGGGMNEIQQK